MWDQNDRASAWSDPARWSVGLLAPSDWQASWIGAPAEPERPFAEWRAENGYMSLLAPGAELVKWVAVDLAQCGRSTRCGYFPS